MHLHDTSTQSVSIFVQLILVFPFLISLIAYIVAVIFSNRSKKKMVAFSYL